jgi:hypothetical protein
VGLFWNLVPVRSQEQGEELARGVEAFLRRAEAHARYPVPLTADDGRLAFFACYNFLDLHGREPLPAGLELLDSRWIEVFPFPLTVAVVPGAAAAGTVLHLQHDRRQVSAAEAAQLGRRLLERLA